MTTTEAGHSGVVAVDAPRETNGQGANDVPGLVRLADRVLEQRVYDDGSLVQARTALEEALRLAPADPDGGIRGRLGRVQFLEQRYAEAQSNLAVARELDPGSKQWADLLQRAKVNASTNASERTMADGRFDPERLLSPPAQFLEEPKNLKGVPKLPQRPLLERIAIESKGIFGTVLGGVIKAGVKVAQATRPDKGPWTSWDQRSYLPATLQLLGKRMWMNKNTLASTYGGDLVGHQQPGQERPAWTERFRTATGAWTTNDPMEGAAGTEFQLQGMGAAENPTNRMLDGTLPSVREVSRAMLTAKNGERALAPFLNTLTMSWIQFQTHDWVSHGVNTVDEAYEVELAPDDPFRRKYGQNRMFIRKTQKNPMRKDGRHLFLNEVTHWWDGSQLYGSDQATQNRLRSGPDGQFLPNGKMALTEDGLLPINPETRMEDAGFTRNWWAGLSALHVLFVKHHNWICDELGQEYPDWETDELFHTARLINAAVMAKIHTVEWTTAVLPNRTVVRALGSNAWGLGETAFTPFEARKVLNRLDLRGELTEGLVGGVCNNHGAPMGFSEKFSEVYRLHSGLLDQYELRKVGAATGKTIALHEMRSAGSRTVLKEFGVSGVLHSLGVQRMGALVNNNFPPSLQDMTIDGQPVVDLGAVDIARARERGVPPYNEFRRQMGLKSLESFQDLGCDAETVAKLEQLYGEGKEGIERLDLLVGTLTEAVRPKYFGFGETLFQIFIQAASRRFQGDPFFTDKYNAEIYTPRGLEIVDEARMSDIMMFHYPELRNTGLATVNNAFEPQDTTAATHPEEHPLTVHAERYLVDRSKKAV